MISLFCAFVGCLLTAFGCEVVSDGGMLFFAIGLESVFWLCVWALWLIWKGGLRNERTHTNKSKTLLQEVRTGIGDR